MNFNIANIVKYGAVLAPLVSAATSAAVVKAEAEDFSTEQLSVLEKIIPLVCGNFELQGGIHTLDLNTTAKAELSSLFKRLADLGVEGAAKINVEEYSGVLRNEIAAQLNDVRACRAKIFSDFQAKPSKPSVDCTNNIGRDVNGSTVENNCGNNPK